MSAIRIEQWPEALDRELRAVLYRPFQWGVHDCCLFAADIVLSLTGVDYAATYRGTYDSALGAARILQRAGGVKAIAERTLGPGMGWQFGQRGDVALVDSTEGEASALGIVCGPTVAVVAPDGLAFIPLPQARWVWGV